MKNAKNKTVLGLMILAAIVSGCTGGGGTEEDEGSSSVTVDEFSAFPNPVPGGQNVQFRLTLVNDGGTDASNVYARLFNPPFGGGSQAFSATSGSVSPDYRTLAFENLNTGTDQTPAVPQTRQVDFSSPNLGPDREVGYSFKSYIAYNYSTTGTAEVQIMGEDKYRDEGSPQNSAGLENSRAPIQMEIRTPTPIPIYDDSSSSVEKQFCAIVRNQGSGVPFRPSDLPTGTSESDFNLTEIQGSENIVNITVRDIGDVRFNSTDEGNNTRSIEIFNGKGVGCFDMIIPTDTATLQRTLPVRIDANYGYRKTGTANLRVEGRR
jgi:hypothetical protein